MIGSQISERKSIYFYSPSLGSCIIFIILYLIPIVILFWQTFRFKAWYFLCPDRVVDRACWISLPCIQR